MKAILSYLTNLKTAWATCEVHEHTQQAEELGFKARLGGGWRERETMIWFVVRPLALLYAQTAFLDKIICAGTQSWEMDKSFVGDVIHLFQGKC